MLSETEAAGIPPVRHRGFDALDKDGDGYLTQKELPPPPMPGRTARALNGDRADQVPVDSTGIMKAVCARPARKIWTPMATGN
jgi:hypothetical protein